MYTCILITTTSPILLLPPSSTPSSLLPSIHRFSSSSSSFLPFLLFLFLARVTNTDSKIMATCGGLSSLFDKPKLPENPTLMESLSAWNQIMPKKTLDSSSFTEIFGELHFHEKCSDPLQLCTEGLGSESCGADVDELQVIEDGSTSSQEALTEDGDQNHCTASPRNELSKNFSDVRSKLSGGFPPPIPSIGSSGKPWISFESYRQDGRFVLREVRVPTKELLHASREDGRLKLQLVQREEDVPEGEEDTNDDGKEEEGSDEEGEEEEMEAAANRGDNH